MKHFWIVLMGLIVLGAGIFVYGNRADLGDIGSKDEVVIEDLVIGEGREVLPNNAVSVHYIGTFEDGTVFDSSYDRQQPAAFFLGRGEIIDGWDIGVPGMKIGGKRKLVIPPSFAYGEEGRGEVIPPNATLIFEIEVLDTLTPEEVEAMQVAP